MSTRKPPREKPAMYRLLNFDNGRYGEPFALCPEHVPVLEERVREHCILYKIAEGALWACAECAREKKKEDD
jgi:hypothetical protein